MNSIITGNEKGKCFICGRHMPTESHHIFFGAANRKLSEKFGLKVDLCHECHNEPPNGVHFSNIQCRFLQKIAQSEAMRYYGWSKDEFMQIFGRNYI